MTDIKNKNHVRLFVASFYDKIRADTILEPIFSSKIKADEWPVHLERAYSFWNSVLLGATDYSGNPFDKHRNLPITEHHFERWLLLFNKAIDENFEGERANEAKKRAELMAQLFISKLERIRENEKKTIL